MCFFVFIRSVTPLGTRGPRFLAILHATTITMLIKTLRRTSKGLNDTT